MMGLEVKRVGILSDWDMVLLFKPGFNIIAWGREMCYQFGIKFSNFLEFLAILCDFLGFSL